MKKYESKWFAIGVSCGVIKLGETREVFFWSLSDFAFVTVDVE